MATRRWFPDPLPLDQIAVDYILSAHKLGIPITLIQKHITTHDYECDEAKISGVLRDNNIHSLKYACFVESATWKCSLLLYLIRKHEPPTLQHPMALADERYAYGLGNPSTDTLVGDYLRSYIEHQINLAPPVNEGAEFRGALWITTAFMDLGYNIEHVFHDITSRQYRTGKDTIMALYTDGYNIRKDHGSNEAYRPQEIGDVDLGLIRYCAAAHVLGMKTHHIRMMTEIFGERIFTKAELEQGLRK